jgi:hypothetical protein
VTATVTTLTVTSLTVTGTAPAVGATAQFNATATLSDRATPSITGLAAWSTSNAAVATVSSSGVVTGVSVGSVDITATYQGVAGVAHVSIAGPPSPASCTFSLSIGSTIDGYPNGGSFAVGVTAPSGCAWTAVSNASWIHVPASAGGSGNGAFVFEVDPNTGPARTGTLTIADRTVTFTQSTNNVVLYNTFGVGDSYANGGYLLIAPSAQSCAVNQCDDVDLASSFTPSQTATFNGVEIAVSLSNQWSGISNPNELDVWLMSDAGGVPGATIELMHVRGTMGSYPGSVRIFNVASSARPLLAAGTKYWIAASVSGPDASALWSSSLTAGLDGAASRSNLGAWRTSGTATQPFAPAIRVSGRLP